MKKTGSVLRNIKKGNVYGDGQNTAVADRSKISANGNEYDEKIRKHRKASFLKFIIIAIIAVAASAGMYYAWQNKVYSSYEVISSIERKDTATTKYKDYNGKIIKYGMDGASCTDADNTALWNQTYEMQNPIIDICENYIAIGDKKGNSIFVFNAEGLQGEIDTLMPIQQIEVSSQGVVAAVLEDGEVTWINFYDKEGKLLVDNKTTMSNSGYPMDIALSNDGEKLAISYLLVNSGVIKTNIAFYNFGSVGQNELDNLVSGYEYDKTVVPSVEFLNNTTAAAFGDNEISLYVGSQKPVVSGKIEVKDEIKSIFYSEEYIGLVFDNDDIENRYRMVIYDLNCKKIMEKAFNRDYDTIKIEGKKIVLFNELECSIYNFRGIEKFHSAFDNEIIDVIPVSGFNKYLIINASETEKIRLK